MAYESRIYVVNKFDTKGFDECVKNYYSCETIAVFNLCRIDDEILGMIQNNAETDCYIWDNEGNPTHTDKYGKGMIEMSLEEALKIFIHAKNFYDYRRYTPIVGLLSGFNLNEWSNLVVLHYGY